MKVIIDTNAFMLPVQFGVDIFKELGRLGFKDFIVPSSVVRELNAIQKFARSKDKMSANVGLKLARECREIITEGNADDAIMELAMDEKAAVFTNDAELKKRLCSEHITVVYLRGMDHLEIM